ncbi:MAG: carboxypeptidase regulatory-like domain-containing protein [Pyrinomonadaceae bacterium]
MNIRKLLTAIACVAFVVAFSISTFAQSRATLRGSISDEFGATIVGATVTLIDANGAQKSATTNADGAYSFTNLAPGKYKIRAIAAGFATSEDTEVEVSVARRDPVNLSLKIAAIESQVKVNADTPVSTDTNNNANQQVITGKDLDALPDDPDELAAALQALAGPSIGPNGGQIFIDGFSGANLPPKEAIREIRINQNPFAPENDQPSARIDILTRPGTDKFRGSANFNFNDESLNSRNPFALSSNKRSPFQIRQFGGSVSGPIVKKKASFYLEANRNETDDNELVRATILDPAFNILQVGQGFLVPRRNTNIGPRLDYAINSNNTLIARYNFFEQKTQNQGVSGFNLPVRGYNFTSKNQNIQLTETAVINAFTINETRFQFAHGRNESLGNSSVASLNVSGAFGACVNNGTACSGVGHAINQSNRWELNNFTQIQKGTHTLKFGGRLRGIKIDDISPNNFAGSWSFTGGFGPALDANNNPIAGSDIQLSSIERYRRTLLIQTNGLTAQQLAFCGAGTAQADCVRRLGGGASSFTINTGNPNASVSQMDLGFYGQDDFRIRPNLMVSYGLRYENQTNISSRFNFAPRIGFAWSPGAANSTKPPKTVIRGGGGIFYNRFSEGQTLQAHRLNGTNQLLYALAEPFLLNNSPTQAQLDLPTARPVYTVLNQFPNVPTAAQLALFPATQQTTWRVASNLQAPAVYLTGIQVERQLPKNISGYAAFYNVRIQHVIRARDINAPLPGTITAATPNGLRPNPAVGDVYEYESSGKYHQANFSLGFNSRLNPRISLSGNYTWSRTTNDTDGQGGSLFPVNSYDFSGEFGRGAGDVRNRFTLFGTINSPWWKLVFSPFIVAASGAPFNIITGRDTNLDRIANERPGFAAAGADCANVNIRCTRFGNFNLNPLPGEAIIPRNYGQGPGQMTVSMRISRTFGFGGEANRSASSQQKGQQKGSPEAAKRGEAGGVANKMGAAMGGVGGGVPRGGGGPEGGRGGGPQMMMMGGPGGASAAQKYSLTASVNFQNLFNRVNLSNPVGNLASPNFGQSLGLAGGFGGFGGGGGGSTGAGNRRIYLNLRFTF